MSFENPNSYNQPNANPSTVGTQFNLFYYERKALVEAQKEQYFQQLADTRTMPKHYGKKIKQYHYMPLLDDRNINDQGIDAAGVVIDSNKFSVTFPTTVVEFAIEADATAFAAAVNAVETGFAVKSGSATPWTVTLQGNMLNDATAAQKNAIVAALPSAIVLQQSGNIYGSSKDIGTITGKLPLVGEHGGRVNRVGFKRKEIEGTFEKFGFFDEYTADSMNFDTDAELMQHMTREMVFGASEITEDVLQIDLINSANTVRYPGAATSIATVSQELTYGDILRLSIELDNNRTAKQTTIVTGSRMIDTRVIPASRIAFIGSELIPTLKSMKDLHNERAFIPAEQYANAGNLVRGEIGMIDQLRFVVVPEMLKFQNAGAPKGSNTTHYGEGNFDVFPVLVVGDGSFTTIGFNTDGGSSKFTIKHKKPGDMLGRDEPYGEIGLMSIKWWYGFMALRPERIGLIYTTAKL